MDVTEGLLEIHERDSALHRSTAKTTVTDSSISVALSLAADPEFSHASIDVEPTDPADASESMLLHSEPDCTLAVQASLTSTAGLPTLVNGFKLADLLLLQLASHSSKPSDKMLDEIIQAFRILKIETSYSRMSRIREKVIKNLTELDLEDVYSTKEHVLKFNATEAPFLSSVLPNTCELVVDMVALESAILQLIHRSLVTPEEWSWWHKEDFVEVETSDGSPELERSYGDFATCDAWKQAEAIYDCQVGNIQNRRLLFLIFYSDETVKETSSGQRYYQVSMTLGNLPAGVRRMYRAWVKVLLIPCYRVRGAQQKGLGQEYATFVRNPCWNLIIQNINAIHAAGGMKLPFYEGGKQVIGIPVMGLLLGDHVEQHKHCCTFLCATAAQPCRECTIDKQAFGRFTANQPQRAPQRDVKTLQAAFAEFSLSRKESVLKKYSHKPWANPFWDCRFALGAGEVYRSTPSDLLHTFGTGIVRQVILYVFKVIEREAGGAGGFAGRMALLRWRALRAPIFNDGIHSLFIFNSGYFGGRTLNPELKGYSGSEIIRMLAQLPFWIGTDDKIIKNGLSQMHLHRLLRTAGALVRECYTRMTWSESQLRNLNKLGQAFFAAVEAVKDSISSVTTGLSTSTIKMHSLNHMVDNIRRFGPPVNFDTGQGGQGEGLNRDLKSEGDRARVGKFRDKSLMKRTLQLTAMEDALLAQQPRDPKASPLLPRLKSQAPATASHPTYATLDATEYGMTGVSGFFLRPNFEDDTACPPPLTYTVKNDNSRRTSVLPSVANVPASSKVAYTRLWDHIGWQCGLFEAYAEGWSEAAIDALPQLTTAAGVARAKNMLTRIKKVSTFTGAVAQAAGAKQVAFRLYGSYGVAQRNRSSRSSVYASVVSTLWNGVIRPWRVEFFLEVEFTGCSGTVRKCLLVVLREFVDSIYRSSDTWFEARPIDLMDQPASLSIVCPTRIIRPELLIPGFGRGNETDPLSVLERHFSTPLAPLAGAKRKYTALSENTDDSHSESDESINSSEDDDDERGGNPEAVLQSSAQRASVSCSEPHDPPVNVTENIPDSGTVITSNAVEILHAVVGGLYDLPFVDTVTKTFQLHQGGRCWWLTSGLYT